MSTLNFRKKFGAVPSGTITGAAVGQINTRGLIDAFITSPKPEIAFFRSEIQRSGVFATEIVTQPLIGTMTYDTELSLLAHKTADMLQSSHAVITRPGIIGVRRAESSGSRPYGSSAGSRPDRNGRKKRFSARDKIAAKRYGRYPSRKNESHGRGSRPPVRRSRHNELQPVYHDDEDHYEDYGSTKEGNLYEDYSQYYDDEEDELDEEDEEDDEVYATYVNSFGHAVIERATCTLAGLLAQTLTGRFMHAWFSRLVGFCWGKVRFYLAAYSWRKVRFSQIQKKNILICCPAATLTGQFRKHVLIQNNNNHPQCRPKENRVASQRRDRAAYWSST
jgi:hypothetical protein